jgi:predicted GH43/DUF377 family glycosyl hydrolase
MPDLDGTPTKSKPKKEKTIYSFPFTLYNNLYIMNMAKKLKKLISMKKSKKPKTAPRRKVAARPRRRKSAKEAELTRAEFNPIIMPIKENDWETWQTFNPGAILLRDRVHFLYRAIGQDGISRLGYASSGDGFKIDERLPHPVYEHYRGHFVLNFYSFASGGSFGGAEDPRIVQVADEDTLYMTYTACDDGLRVGFTSIRVNDFLNKIWKWRPAVIISPPGETHKNWVIFPDKINDKYAILHTVNPQIGVAYFDNLGFDGTTYIKSDFNGSCERKNGYFWEGYVRGAGAPPIKTKYGWLVFYHALEKDDLSKYKVGAMLLDLADPTKVLYRSEKPVLEPKEVYENNGFKPGIIYVSGAVVKDGTLLVYYGGADSYVNLAYADLEEFLQNLMQNQESKLKNVKHQK